MFRAVLVDDHRVLQQGLKKLIESSGETQVVGTAETARDGLQIVKEHEPDLGIFDLGLPDHSGFWLISRVRKIFPEMPILVLSMHTEVELVDSVIRAGANGYLCKSTEAETLLAAIRGVMDGQTYLESGVLEMLRNFDGGQKLAKRTLQNDFETVLDPKELEVLRLVAAGLANQQIGTELGVSISTVKARMRSIFGKFQVDTRTQAVAAAIRLGVLPSE